MWDKIKSYLTGILSIVSLVLAVLVLYFRRRKIDDEALLQNQDTKNKLNKIDEQISKNDGLTAAEEEKRKQIESDLKQKESENVSKDNVLDFLNKRNKPN